MKFHTKVNESKIKYSTTYKVNATSILDARAQNWVFSAFLVLKIPLSHTVIYPLSAERWRRFSVEIFCFAEGLSDRFIAFPRGALQSRMKEKEDYRCLVTSS